MKSLSLKRQRVYSVRSARYNFLPKTCYRIANNDDPNGEQKQRQDCEHQGRDMKCFAPALKPHAHRRRVHVRMLPILRRKVCSCAITEVSQLREAARQRPRNQTEGEPHKSTRYRGELRGVCR